MSEKFEDLWLEINDGYSLVQDREELEHIFNLIQGCKSYLEVGTAEGKSLYVLSHALEPYSEITSIDLGEKHVMERRALYIDKIIKNHRVYEIIGNSGWRSVHNVVKNKNFDAVLIDAGHDLKDVLVDAYLYGPLATKYLIFHDVNLPDVAEVFDWYLKSYPHKKSYKFIRTENYGYGIIEV